MAGAEYQKSSAPITVGTIVVAETVPRDYPGYPFYIGRVMSISNRSKFEQSVYEVEYLVRAFEEEEQELFEWYMQTKIAKEKNFCIATKLGEQGELEYYQEVVDNEHTQDVKRVLKQLGATCDIVPGLIPDNDHDDGKQEHIDDQDNQHEDKENNVRRGKKKSKVTSSTKKGAKNKQQTVQPSNATQRRSSARAKKKVVSYKDADDDNDDDDDVKGAESAEDDDITRKIKDLDMPKDLLMLKKDLNFAHHFPRHIVPDEYQLAKGCDMEHHDDDIKTWRWGMFDGTYYPAKLLREQIIIWDLPDKAFKKWPRKSDIAAAFSKRSYELTEQFFRKINTYLKHQRNAKAAAKRQQQITRKRHEQLREKEKQAQQIELTRQRQRATLQDITNISSNSNNGDGGVVDQLISDAQSSELSSGQVDVILAGSSQHNGSAGRPIIFHRLRRSLEERMCCLGEQVVHSLHRQYMIMNHRATEVYQVDIKSEPTCTCQDFMSKQNRCKHILFVLVRVLKGVDLSWESKLGELKKDKDKGEIQKIAESFQRIHYSQFTEHDLNILFRPSPAPPPVTDSVIDVDNSNDMSLTSVTRRRNKRADPPRPVSPADMKEPQPGDTCCICYEDITIDQQLKGELVYCKRQCAVNIHRSCFTVWRQHQKKSKLTLSCPHCRSAWM